MFNAELTMQTLHNRLFWPPLMSWPLGHGHMALSPPFSHCTGWTHQPLSSFYVRENKEELKHVVCKQAKRNPMSGTTVEHFLMWCSICKLFSLDQLEMGAKEEVGWLTVPLYPCLQHPYWQHDMKTFRSNQMQSQEYSSSFSKDCKRW